MVVYKSRERKFTAKRKLGFFLNEVKEESKDRVNPNLYDCGPIGVFLKYRITSRGLYLKDPR